MNKETAKILVEMANDIEKYKVVEAFANGEKIQFKSKSSPNKWIEIGDPDFVFDLFDYRVKPKSLTIWVARWDPISNWDITWQVSTNKEYFDSYKKLQGFEMKEVTFNPDDGE